MKVLLAGPGTGKTARVRSIVDKDFADAERVLILSFTNATVQDLTASFSGYPGVECQTLHSYALKINHLKDHYILDAKQEAPILEKLADSPDGDLGFLCAQLKCISFDAMIAECLRFLKTNPVYGSEQIGELDLLIVDEYQDFNATERTLVEAISEFAAEIIILGDDDQSIYGFKDADPDGIIELYGRDGIERIDHEHICFRCPDTVVECATKLITHNKHRVEKPWRTSGRAGECIPKQFLSQRETNEFIVSEIERIRGEEPTTTFLILSPVRYYADELVKMLTDRDLEFVDFWESPLGLEDYTRVWWLRAIYSERKLLNLLFLSKGLTSHYRRKLKTFLGSALREDFNQSMVIGSIAEFYDSTFSGYLHNPPDLAEFARAHDEFSELVERIDEENMGHSLDSLLRDIDPRQEFQAGSVNIMSIHKSKGLQADVVFVNGLVNGVLPNEIKGIDTIEAQRRLLFVGVTRALRSLYLLSPVEWDGKYIHRVDKTQFNYNWRRKAWRGQTSMFVQEMM